MGDLEAAVLGDLEHVSKRNKRRGITGRRWRRRDSPSLAPGDLDPSGKLEIVNPDIGTRGGKRYASARCHCGCNVVVEARITHFVAGKASCPTRWKAQKRGYMIRKEHIEKMKLLGRMLGTGADGIPIVAVNAGLEYAHRLTTDPALQAEVKNAYNPSLAVRDLKRATEVLERYGKTPEPEPVKTVTPTRVTGEYMPKELEPLGIMGRNTDGTYYWSVKGEAWKQAGRPDPHTWGYTPPQRKPITPSTLVVKQSALTRERLYIETDEGYHALEVYWQIYKHEPPDTLDLKAWYEAQQ